MPIKFIKINLHNFYAFLFGCLIVIIAFLLLEIISIPIFKRNFNIIYKENPPVLILTKDNLRKLKPGISSRAEIKKGNDPIIIYNYSIDEKGRRKTYQSLEEDKKLNCLFMGGSYTFGVGVNDDETLPSQFAMRNPLCNVYNYGIPGGSPQEIYLMTLDPNFADDIENLPTIVIYTFISHHLNRLVGTWSIIGA